MASKSSNQKLLQHAMQRGAQLGLVPKSNIISKNLARFGPDLKVMVVPSLRWGAMGVAAFLYLAEPYPIFKYIPGTWAYAEEAKKQAEKM